MGTDSPVAPNSLPKHLRSCSSRPTITQSKPTNSNTLNKPGNERRFRIPVKWERIVQEHQVLRPNTNHPVPQGPRPTQTQYKPTNSNTLNKPGNERRFRIPVKWERIVQ